MNCDIKNGFVLCEKMFDIKGTLVGFLLQLLKVVKRKNEADTDQHLPSTLDKPGSCFYWSNWANCLSHHILLYI